MIFPSRGRAGTEKHGQRGIDGIATAIDCHLCGSATCSLQYSRDHSSNLKPFSSTSHKLLKLNFCCNCATGDSGENESKTILDAFFLGKAVAEALTERVESAVGEFLSTIGRLQAEQQKQVLEFQEDVLEKARRAKEQAAREAMEAQGLTPKSAAVDKMSPVNGIAVNPPSSVSDSANSTDSSFLESKPPVKKTL